MAEIDPVILELIARNERYTAELRNTTRVAEQQLGQQEQRVRQLENQIKRSSDEIGGQFKRMAGVIAGAFSAREIVRMADSWSDLSSQVGVAVRDMERAPEIMDRLTQVARASYSPLEQTAEQFARNNRTLEQMGYSVNDALNYTEALNNALVATATRGDRARQVQDALSKAIATGRLEAQGLENILTHGGAVAEVLARHLGVTTNELYKLRQEGKITGDVLVQSLINNFDELRAQAEEMPATVGDGFIILRNELMKYLGETDQALGATERMATALIALGDNIDVVAKGVALLASVMIGRYAAGALVAGRATQALVAHLSIATTSLAGTALAARSAGAALMGVFGGPVGLAVAALTAGVIYFATEVETTAQLAERLAKETDQLADKTDRLVGRMRDAGVSVEGLGGKSDRAASKIDGLKTSMELATAAAVDMFDKLQRLEIVQDAAELRQIRAQRDALQRPDFVGSLADGPAAMGAALGQIVRNTIGSEADNAAIRELNRREAEIERKWEVRARAIENGIELEEESNVIAARALDEEKRKKEKKARGPTAEDIEQRHQNELSRLRQEEIAARLALTDNVQDRADLQQDLLREEYVQRSAQLANDEYFTAEQKRAQQAILDALYGYMRDTQGNIIQGAPGLYQQDVRRELEQHEADMARDILAMQADALEAQADLATTLDQRRFLESAALDIGHQIERSLLEEAIAQGRIAEAAKARALLGERQAAEREGLRRDNMSARERYVFDLRNRDINEALEGIEVAGLERLNDELAEAITGAKSLGEAFKNTAQQIIQDLARIAIQQAVIKPLAGALFGADGGGGGLLGGLFGGFRANGGPVNPGKAYMVGEMGRELFVPDTPGHIVPNQRLAGALGGGGGQQIYVDARGAVMNDQFASMILKQAKGYAAEAGTRSYEQSMRDAPGAVQHAQRYNRSR